MENKSVKSKTGAMPTKKRRMQLNAALRRNLQRRKAKEAAAASKDEKR